jgi:hypothetical protein
VCPFLIWYQIVLGDVAQLEQLLPQIAYGNILAEDPESLTQRHFRQLVLLGQSALDYLWAICLATSKVMVSLEPVVMSLSWNSCCGRSTVQDTCNGDTWLSVKQFITYI